MKTVTIPSVEKHYGRGEYERIESQIHSATISILDNHREVFATGGQGYYGDPGLKEIQRIEAYQHEGPGITQTMKRINRGIRKLVKLGSHYNPVAMELQELNEQIAKTIDPFNPPHDC